MKCMSIGIKAIFLLSFLSFCLSTALWNSHQKPKAANKTNKQKAPNKNTTAKAKTNTTKANNGTNVLGKLRPHSTVSKKPYEIQRCDQVLQIEGESVKADNFFEKKKQFFTISAYLITSFAKKDPNTLNKFILMEKITEMPTIMPGSVSCIKFKSKKDEILMCLKTHEEAEHVITAFRRLMKCRIGDNLHELSPVIKLRRLLETSCLGLKVVFDPEKYRNDPNKGRAALEVAYLSALKNTEITLKKKKEKTDTLFGQFGSKKKI